jgi:DNA-binding transcriptional MerR regulator
MKSILYAAVMRMLAAALLGMSALVVVPQSAYALDAEYSALTKALDNLHDAYTDLNKIDAKIKAHEGKVMGQDPWTFGNRFARNYYKKRDELLGERKKILTRIKRLKSEVKKKAADFNRAMKPFNDLRRDALRKYQAIQASSSGNPSNKRRALAAISNDLEKLQGSVFNKQIQMLDTVTRLIRVGRPLEEVKEQLQDLVGNDMDKVFADALGVAVDERALKERPGFLDRFLPVLEGQLDTTPYLAGNDMTVADISLLATIDPSELIGVDIKRYPKLNAWRDDLRSQEFYRRVHQFYGEGMSAGG